MLSAQHKEFDEKKNDASPYPRDFTRWYALDYFLRRRALAAKRWHYTFGAFLLFSGLSAATLVPGWQQVHQASPVSRAHGMFQQNCAECHDRSFQPALRLFGCGAASVSDKTCNDCHHGAIHHSNQSHEPACASCHREHQGHDILASNVADRHCTQCHKDLSTGLRPTTNSAFHATISNFNRDHPEFAPSLKGKKDQAKIKFNHKAHLDLDLDDLRRANEVTGRDELRGLAAKLDCADCHQMDDERKYLKPIAYDRHCARCHALNVALIGDFAGNLKQAAAAFSNTPLPHKEPAVVRAVLRDRLVEFAQQNGVAAGKSAPAVPRPLPWKPVTEEQWSWAKGQAAKAEELLFMNRQWHKAETLTACSHCHVEKERVGGLPVFHPTAIPARWYTHSVFDHGSHRHMTCKDCHDRNAAGIAVAASRTAEDILLPTLQSCQECHTGRGGGARNACVECHRYHQR